MPGIMVGGEKLELDVVKMRAIADRIRYAQTTGEAITAAADACVELMRLADGFDRLGAAEEAMRARAVAAVQGFFGHLSGALEILSPAECQCPNCLARREAEARGELCQCPNCVARRATAAEAKRGLN